MSAWTEPVIAWSPPEANDWYQELIAQAERLATWPPAPDDGSPTDCLRIGIDFLIWQPAFGGLLFPPHPPNCRALPAPSADPVWFAHVVTRSWLPAVYQVWGRQVLHASAAVHVETGRVVAFAGPSGAGKSTMAYGLAQRPGWRLLADDTLAFSVSDGQIALHPLTNTVRLRPSAAAYFAVAAGPSARSIPWPDVPLVLDRVCFLDASESTREVAEVAPLGAPDAYRRLLTQAHAFSLQLAEYNQRLMRDYLALAAAASVVHVRYRRAFADLARVLDCITTGRTTSSSVV